MPDGKGNWVECEVKDGKCVRRTVVKLSEKNMEGDRP